MLCFLGKSQIRQKASEKNHIRQFYNFFCLICLFWGSGEVVFPRPWRGSPGQAEPCSPARGHRVSFPPWNQPNSLVLLSLVLTSLRSTPRLRSNTLSLSHSLTLPISLSLSLPLKISLSLTLSFYLSLAGSLSLYIMHAVKLLSGPFVLIVCIWAICFLTQCVAQKALRNNGFPNIFVRQVSMTGQKCMVVIWATSAIFCAKLAETQTTTLGPSKTTKKSPNLPVWLLKMLKYLFTMFLEDPNNCTHKTPPQKRCLTKI